MQLRRQFAKGVDAGRGDTALKRAEPRRSRVRSFVTRGRTAVLLAAFAALLALPVQAQTPDEDADASQSTDPRAETQIARAATEGAQVVPLDWSLIPDGLGLGAGDEFRLLFLSSTVRDATSNRIVPYNSFIQDLAAAGHADVQAYSSGFRVVGCTFTIDARDNTKTTYTDSDKGVPIYWLGADRKVADDYQDFYDWTWTNESRNRNEFGSGNRDTAQSENQPFTGCNHDGTGITSGTFKTLGAASGRVQTGRPANPTSGVGPIDGDLSTLAVNLRPFYGLSEVFHVGSPDATLSALRVADTGGSRLSPRFSPQRQDYALSVGESIDQITIHPTPSHSGATYEIFRRGDPATVDANPNLPGFQIQLLSSPVTIIRVRVRAQDTVAQKTYNVVVTRQPKAVPADWSLIPAGFTTGDEFRLLFLSSTKRNSGSHDLRVFDTFIQDLAGAGHPDIQAYKAGFKVVGCTDSVDANEHTGTIYSPAAPGVPIYWLNGNKVADDYADFYDGNWDDEANDKNEFGENGFDTSLENNYPYTGCDHDGTQSPTTIGLSNALGYPWTRVGQPNDSAANAGPLSSDHAVPGQNPEPGSVNHPFYGLSETFVVGSTDDDLTGLELQDPDGTAIALTPTFASGTTDYTASVLYEVDVVTVIPTLSHSHATYEIQDGVGTVLYDADSNADGFQVALRYYRANTINVVVTAQDVSHTQTYTVVVAREPLTVPDTWSLLPPGLVRGDRFRVLFLSSEKFGHLSSDISGYNRFIRETAAAGHTDLQPYSSLFRAVGCTEDIDARDNTYTNTNYTTGQQGIPIYWLNGTKVADDYEDFYDGSWDDEVNDTDETGADGPDTSIAGNYPLTGCDHDGTENFFDGDSVALGSGGLVQVGRPSYDLLIPDTFTGDGPISSHFLVSDPGDENPMYGLSEVFEVLYGDATLIDLALKDDLNTDIPLTPAFDPDTLQYNARVATSVNEVTIIPTVNESHATYEFRTRFTGKLLPDSNPNKNGFQRKLRGGRAIVNVVVTAEHRPTTITYRVHITSGATPVLDVWSLTPPGLVADEEFRLLFLSSTMRDGSSSDIADYNTFISDLVAVGHDDIQEYSSGFRVVGCTVDVDARDNTTTTYTSTETGVPIYWLGGAKVADDYEDFYDGSWDDEANDKDESGANGPDTSLDTNFPLTGCDHDGTEAFQTGASRALGNDSGFPILIRVGRPNASTNINSPLSSAFATSAHATRPMYGLSETFRVVSTDATLSDLAIKDNAGAAITLTPEFTSGTTDYTAFVVNSVDEVTLIPTVNEGNATYEIQDGSGTPLEDADLNEADFQVALSEGPNTFKVEVTAQAEEYTQTYTVVVTRTSPVTISADRTSAIYGEDGVDFTLTRLGSVDDYLTVQVNLTQTEAYLSAASLSRTVVFAPGSATEELEIEDSQFRRLASGTVAEKGTLTATVAEGVGYTVGTPNSAEVDIIIAATIGFGELSYTVSEEAGSPLTFTVVVRTGDGAPQPDATISVGLGTFLTGSATSPEDYQTLSEDLDFSPSDFTADGTVYEGRKSIDIPIIDDDIADSGETFLIRLQFAPGLLDKYWYNFVDSTGQRCGSTCVVTATITDTDPGVTVSKTALAVVEGHATGASYTVVLNTQPTADVTVTVAGHAGTDATPNPTTLTFTSMTWATAQTVNVTAGEDSDTVNDTVSLTHSSTSTDSDYDAITIAGVVVTVIDNDAGPGVTVSKTALTVTEGYLTGESYTVILNTQPTADVTVTVAGHAGTDVTATPATLTFTSTTWATAQTVTVTAGEDDDEVNDTVSLTHSAASTDTAYDGITIAGVTVTVTDNDISVVTVSADMAEANGNLDRVMFDLPWPSYTVSRTGSIARSLTVDLNVPSNPYTSQSSFTVTIPEGVRSAQLEFGDSYFSQASVAGTLTVEVVESASFLEGPPASISITRIEPAITLEIEDGTSFQVSEGAGTVTFTLVARTAAGLPAPSRGWETDPGFGLSWGLETVPVSPGATDGSDFVGFSGVSAVTGAWVAHDDHFRHVSTYDLEILDDMIAEPEEELSLSLGASTLPLPWSSYLDRNCPDVSCLHTVTITDDDTAGITVFETGLTIQEGSSDTYTVVLDTQPAGTVTVTVSGHAGTDASLDKTTLTFTTTTWSTAQEVTVTAGQDADAEDETDVTLSHAVSSSADAAYNGITAGSVTVSITDNDTEGVTVSETALTIVEGSNDTYTVVLDTQPAGTVTVTVSGHAGTDASLDKTTLTFTTTTWSTAQEVTVTAGQDADAEDETDVTLSHAVSSSADAAYNGIAAGSVTVSITDNDTEGVTVSETALTIQEGSNDTYTVVLDTQPAGTVTVTVSGHAGTDASLDKTTLTFTTTTWSTAQEVTVTAGQDADAEDETDVTLSHAVSSSADAAYNGIAAGSVTVSITDNDTEGVTVSETALTIQEGSNDTYTVVLDTQPAGTVTVTVSGHAGTDASLDKTTLTFTTTTWSTAQEVTVTVGQDADAEDETDVTLSHAVSSSADAAYNGIAAGSVTVSITDNDTEGVTVSETALTIQEGSNDTYTVVLNTQPAGTVTVTVSGHAGTDASLDKTTLTFTTTTWSTAQEVTVTAGQDADAEDETDVTLSHAVSSSADAAYNGIAAGSVTVSITDNDTEGVTVSETALTIQEGSNDTYTVVLDTQPAGTVTVTVSGHAGTDASLDKTTLTFTTTTWSTAQEVTVTAGQDADAEDETDVTLSHAVSSSADAAYNGIAAGSVTVSITDNDTEGVTVSETALTIQEGSNDTYTVVLDTQPAGTVTVTVSGHAGTDASLDKTTLTFTTTTWSTAQEVTVTAGQDADAEDETDVTLSHAVSSSADAAYNGITAGSVTVSINDNDTEGVTVSETGLTIVEGSNDTYTVVLDTQPAGTVTVTVSGHAGTDASLDKTTLTFTTTTWSTAQEVTVTAGQDADAEDETDVTLSHAVSSSADAAYNGITAGSVTVSINDNDTEGVTVSETGLTIVEGSNDTYTVVLDTQPAGTVTVTVSGHAGTDASLDKTTLTFTTTTWSTAQEVTVTAGQDADAEDETDVTLSHAVSSSADAAYNGITAGSVTVSINDNDTEGVTVSETGLTIVEGSNDTYTVVLDTQPAGTVTVTVSGHAGTDASLDKTTLTFTTTTWSTAQEVTVTAGQDADAEDETDVTLSHAVSSSADAAYNGITAGSVTVSINDNDTEGVTVSETGLTIVEGSNDTYTVVLNTQPAGTVTVTVSGHAGTDASLDKTTLTFTTTTWSTAQEVTVTAGQDADAEDETDVTLSHAVSSSADAAYNGITAGSVTVSINDNDTEGVTVSETGLTIVEGSNDTYTVVLNTQPAGTVTVTVSGHAGTDASLDKTTLTFTTTTWSTAQEVTVTAGQDADAEDETDVTLSHAVSSSADAAYNGITAGSVTVSITDNDTEGVTVSETGLTIVEGSSDTYTVVLNTQPAGTVTVTVSGHAGTDASLDKTTLTFTTTTWSTAQEVTVTAGQDADAEDETDVTLSHAVSSSADAAYNGITAGSVTVSINDNDTEGVTVSETGLTIVEGSNDTYTVVLNTQPAGTVTVTVSGHAGTDASLDKTTLTFTTTTWSTAQEVTVTAGQDADAEDETDVTLSHAVSSSADAAYNGITAGSVTVSITDNDTEGVTVSETGLTIVEGSNDTYTVVLDTQPAGTVTVTVSGHAGTDASLDKTTLTFTTTTWSTAQEVTVTAGQDADAEDETDVTLSHAVSSSADAAYNGITAGSVTVSITDNDTEGVTVSETGLTIVEGSSDTYTVVLNTQPAGTVTVTVSGHAGTDASLDKTTLTFTTTTWSTAQEVTVTAGQDADAEDETDVTLSHAVSSSADAAYNGITAGSVTVSINDNDTEGVTVSETGLTIVEGSSDTYTVVLDTQPAGTVTVTVSGHAGTDASLDKTTLTFTTTTWSTAQEVTVTAGQDADAEDETDVTLSHAVSSSADAAYNGITAGSVTVSINDNDTEGVTVSETGLTIVEGSNDTYTVVLDTQPAGTVTVTVSGHAGTDASLDKTTLTFTTTTWSTAQEVTVTAGQDADAEDETDVTLSHAVSSSADAAYNGITAGSVTVSINDNDTEGVTVSETGLTIVEGSNDTYTVVLDTQPAGTVTVTVSGHAGTDASLDKTTLTFTTTTWSTAQEVTVTAGQDADAEDETDVTLSHAVSSSADAAYNGITAGSVTVSINDNDTEGVTVSETGLTIVEGSNDTYTVVLDTQPAGTVTVTVSGHAGTDASLDKTTLTFTTTTWSTAQEVTVTAGQDADAEDETDVTLSHAVSSSADAAYNGITAGSVTVSINDNDTEGVTVSETGLTIVEGSNDTYTVVLDTQPAGTVTVTVSGHAGTDASLDKTTLTFTTTTWSTAQEVTVTAGQDADAEDETDVTLSHAVSSSADAAYNGITAGSVTVSINDNDTEGATVSETGLTIVEGSNDTYTVVLDTQPAGTVTVTVSGHAGTDASLDKTTLTFTTTTWSTAQEVTVTAGQDADAEDETDVTLSHAVSSSADAAYNGIAAGSVTVSITDNDTEGATVSETGLTIVEGSNDTYTVVLDTQPAGTVTVTVSGHAGTDASLDKTTLTFTTTTWSTAQEVTVTAGQDADAEDETDVTLSHAVSSSADAAYNGIAAGSVTVSITDNDTEGVTVSETGLTIVEGSSDTYTVVLNTQPAGTVTVTVSGHAGTDASLDKTTLTFTTTTWSTAQEVTVTAGQDADAEDEMDVTLSHAVSSSAAAAYNGIAAGSVTVSINDNDTTDDDVPAVTVSYEQATYVATEGGPNATVTVLLGSPAPGQVYIPLTDEGQGGATSSDWSGVPEGLTFNAGDTSRSFTVIAVDDEVDDDGEMVELGFRALPSGFAPGIPATALVTLINDDMSPPEPVRNQCPDDSGQRMVLVRNGDISQAGESDFWRVELDPWRFYVIEVLGSDGGPDILGEANPGNLTVSDPHLYGVWNGDRSELISNSGTRNRARILVERADDFSGFQQFEVRSFGGNTGTYQIKIRVNNICVMTDGKATYSYDGGPDGYTSDRPADPSTGDTFRLRPRPSEDISQSFLGFLGDNWGWYWDGTPDEDWFAIEGVSEDYEYTINVETIDDLPAKHQATRLKILAIYDSTGMEVPGTSGTGSGRKVSLTFQPDNTGLFYVSVGSDRSDRTGVYQITISARNLQGGSNQGRSSEPPAEPDKAK